MNWRFCCRLAVCLLIFGESVTASSAGGWWYLVAVGGVVLSGRLFSRWFEARA